MNINEIIKRCEKEHSSELANRCARDLMEDTEVRYLAWEYALNVRSETGESVTFVYRPAGWCPSTWRFRNFCK